MQEILDLYIDYLICSTSYTTAVGLSRLTNNAVSHDKITRFLSSKDYSNLDLWKVAKPYCKSIEGTGSVIIIDDCIEEKPYTDENEIVSWHYSHTDGRSIKGINFVTALLRTEKGSCPVGYELVRKTKESINEKTGKKQRKSPVSKQQNYRSLLSMAIANGIQFEYVLNDTWFASKENMNFIRNDLKKQFIIPLKANRKVALSEEDKPLGHFVRIDSVKPEENTLVRLEGVDFPLRFTRQVFKNEDGSAGVLYLVSSNLDLTDEQIQAIYKKRWKVEEYHQSLKMNASLDKSPAKTPRTQANHIFASLCAYIRLDQLAHNTNNNHHSLKRKIYLEALKKAMLELQKFKNQICQSEYSSYAPA